MHSRGQKIQTDSTFATLEQNICLLWFHLGSIFFINYLHSSSLIANISCSDFSKQWQSMHTFMLQSLQWHACFSVVTLQLVAHLWIAHFALPTGTNVSYLALIKNKISDFLIQKTTHHSHARILILNLH